MSLEELKKHKFIIIGIDHYNPLGIARSLGINGINSILIIKKGGKLAARIASASKYVKTVHTVRTFEELTGLLMREYGTEEYKPFVYPCDDVATGYLDSDYDKLKDHFYIENCGKAGRIQHFMKKENLNEAARDHGLQVARTWDLDNDVIPSDVVYPVITKPFESYAGWKKDYYVCNNKGELEKALQKVKGKVFIQQYIKKKTELCLDGYVINNGKDNCVTIASVYTYLLPDYYSMEMIVSNFDNEDLKQKIGEMFRDIGYEGIYSLEFLVDENDDKWFLEINFRNSTWSWASTCVGMNLPLLWAYGTLTGEIPEEAYKKVPENYIAIAEIPDYQQRVKKHKMLTFGEWRKKISQANCLYYYDKRDKLPAISAWTNRILRDILHK